MANKYNQGAVSSSETRFSAAPMSGLEFSRMTSHPHHATTFNAGDIVPIKCIEVLPHDTFSIDVDEIIRQNTVLTPTFGQMDIDVYAFFEPNRIANKSWKNVMGENSFDSWTTNEVTLAPLYPPYLTSGVQVPVGSVADHYGFPTQGVIPAEVLQSCNDLKFRGYLDIYNNYFRDENYQPPIPFSRLNVYEGFFEPVGSTIPIRTNQNADSTITITGSSSGSEGRGTIVQAVFGEGSTVSAQNGQITVKPRLSSWSALSQPLKANKRHDYFTSVLPSPQKGQDVTFSLSQSAPLLNRYAPLNNVANVLTSQITAVDSQGNPVGDGILATYGNGLLGYTTEGLGGMDDNVRLKLSADLNDVKVDLTNASSITVGELRMGSAIQQTYELLARGGSRYREFVKSFFGIETDDPFSDIPKYLGHIRRGLDLYQTAQTSASAEGSTPQGNLSAFGYTSTGGKLFHETFLEHGYVHILAVVRHENIYSSFLSRDNFRVSQLDFYLPTLANISEQPVYTREINPFCEDTSAVWGYNESWCEYRFDPSTCSGMLRNFPTELGENDLSIWDYADPFDASLVIADGNWLKSNSAEVLDRTLAITSDVAPQFKAFFTFHIDKQRPMPTYSVPGADII